MKRKVLFFLFGGVGGAERMTLTIAKMLPLERYEVKFVVCGRLKDIYNFLPAGYDVLTIEWHNIHVFPRIRLANVIHKEKPDFVYSSTMQLNVLLLQAAHWMQVKCIVRNDNMLDYVSDSMKRRLAKYYPLAHRVIAQQEEMQAELIDLLHSDTSQVVCLHNPLDVKLILSKIDEPSPYPAGNAINYLWVGNYLPTKGHDLLAQAFAIVHSRRPETHLYFVGNIVETFPNYQKTKRIVTEAGLTDFVHFVGQQSNPYKWMKYCDCFVLPSRKEGLPNVLLEAMFLRRPVVASVCVPVIDRMVKDGINGYKVKPEAVEDMAIAMEKSLALEHPEPIFQSSTEEDFVKLFE